MNTQLRCANKYCNNKPKVNIIGLASPHEKVEGTTAVASDGTTVYLGHYACGVHGRVAPDQRWRAISTDAAYEMDRINGDPDHDIKVAVEAYERHLIDIRVRAERAEREYSERMLRDSKAGHQIIEEKRGEVTGYTVTDTDTGRPLDTITVVRDGGVWKASIGQHGGSVGRGRGNASYLRTVAGLYLDLANEIERRNSKEGE